MLQWVPSTTETQSDPWDLGSSQSSTALCRGSELTTSLLLVRRRRSGLFSPMTEGPPSFSQASESVPHLAAQPPLGRSWSVKPGHFGRR